MAFTRVDFLFLVVVSVHLFICPFTKVEESFNLQAIHDLFFHGSDLGGYDHNEFPGVVPRTFIGAIAVAFAALPGQLVLSTINAPKLWHLYVVRFAIACLATYCNSRFRNQISVVFGKETSNIYVMLLCSQFHFPFYVTRTLPNTFALLIVLISYSYWLQCKWNNMIFTFTFATIIIRSELAILFGPILLYLLLSRKINFLRTLKIGIISTVFSLVFSILIDSIFWGRILWPEGAVFYFNTVLNKSHEWGVSPWHWYFTNALPRSLLSCASFIPIALFYDKRSYQYFVPVLVFVSIYSYLPHKELRFIFYAIPMFTLISAIGFHRMLINRNKSLLNKCLYIGMTSFVCLNIVASSFMLYVSSLNYPGGHALQYLHSHVNASPNLTVHMDVASCMTGVSRFGEANISWRYSKDENVSDYSGFDYLISENSTIENFEVIHKELGYSSIAINKYIPSIVLEPKIYVLKNVRNVH